MIQDTYVMINGKPTIMKDPIAALDYPFDWTEWLDEVSDTLASHLVTVDTGLTLDSSIISGKKVVAYLSGGTVGQTYKVACKITTSAVPPRVDERTIYVKVQER